MKKLVVIYGPPRSATTFMLGALVQHVKCHGTDVLNADLGVSEIITHEGTNENPLIEINQVGEYSPILSLFEKLNVPDNEYLVIKAPGYCSAWEYFKNSPFDCKFIFVNRDKYEVGYSMMNHENSRKVLDFDIMSVDCPKDKIDFYQDLWNESKPEGRALLRVHWHLNSIHPDMKKASLCFNDYSGRQDAYKTYMNIINYLHIPGNESLEAALNLFKFKKTRPNVLKEFKRNCQNVIDKLGDF
jgi:hypothetical protein